jgi:DNA adenine methylase
MSSYNLLPILKWVGGKRDIISNIFDKFPKEIDNYYELFIGGGSVFLELISRCEKNEIKVNKFILNDINETLITMYNNIKNNDELEILIKELKTLNENYNKATHIEYPKRHKYQIDLNENIENVIKKGKSFLYYYYRQLYNSISNNTILKSALLIFLNKTCFRGLYREGPNGFNVPFGNYENPSIYDEHYLKHLNHIFKKYDITFSNINFRDFKSFNKNDFVYLDPPYYPVNDKSFVEYNESGFGKKENEELYELCKLLNKVSIKFIHSNSSASFILEKYKEFKIENINVKRRINSKNPESSVLEVLIFN